MENGGFDDTAVTEEITTTVVDEAGFGNTETVTDKVVTDATAGTPAIPRKMIKASFILGIVGTSLAAIALTVGIVALAVGSHGSRHGDMRGSVTITEKFDGGRGHMTERFEEEFSGGRGMRGHMDERFVEEFSGSVDGRGGRVERFSDEDLTTERGTSGDATHKNIRERISEDSKQSS